MVRKWVTGIWDGRAGRIFGLGMAAHVGGISEVMVKVSGLKTYRNLEAREF